MTKKWREWGPPLRDRVSCTISEFTVRSIATDNDNSITRKGKGPNLRDLYAAPSWENFALTIKSDRLDSSKSRLTVPPCVGGIKESERLPSFDLLHSTLRSPARQFARE